MSRIYLSAPDVGEAEEQLVVDAIRSGWVAPLGEHVDKFEAEVAARVGARNAVALSSGTSALHLALVSWGVGPGDHVPTSSLTFVATANAISYTGATPVFVDSEPTSGNIDVDLLEETILRLRAEGKNVPAIVPVDLLGTCVDYARIGDLADRLDVKILSDAAESFGSRSGDLEAGAFGDAAVLSFNGNKIMTTSGGGMLVTDDAALADHARFLATQAREPVPHYEHEERGYNYRLSNLLAALGRGQLARLDEMIARRRSLRQKYAARLGSLDGVRLLGDPAGTDDNCWLTAIVVDPGVAGWNVTDLGAALGRQDIESRPLWKPMHRQPLYADHPSALNGVSDRLFEQGLSLPSGSVMTDDDVARVMDTVDAFLQG
ncbi:pyridoxal-5'-phosphate-dependent protein [Aeromicrobium sp. Root495]|uniref:DegT/DnrJ/EryC1/StrS family aminotransferase n=1 Tax=Aeromicrobium sp. Root495 TaxID=1736550 RepID=UPI0006FEF721|nr:aminotransferase class V-fold PLP-dependent enzyme [Aeromicrobium sp. Root495]KQY60074.1 pyridoxal-5'-phosphate-dependent protein [Aeromicrobium sp. Root495]